MYRGATYPHRVYTMPTPSVRYASVPSKQCMPLPGKHSDSAWLNRLLLRCGQRGSDKLVQVYRR
eukprot:scaffold1574_cov373-Prasinococcus_capsulatus_cf.AAC.3